MFSFILRVIIILIAIPLLIPVTIYAVYRKLQFLPFGLNKFLGNEEDNWDGNGGALVKRKAWLSPDGSTMQGWWYDYLNLNYHKLSFWQRWWLSYKWCALRNPAWNLRNVDLFSISVKKNDSRIIAIKGNTDKTDSTSKKDLSYTVEFASNSRLYKSYYRLKVFSWGALMFRWGWKIYPDLMMSDKPMPIHKTRSVYICQIKVIKI